MTDKTARMPSRRLLRCSRVNKRIDSRTAPTRRVLMEGPVANKCVIVGCLEQKGDAESAECKRVNNQSS